MSKSIKAALWSALVFPGAGHFYLKKHITGLVLTGVTCASLYLVISKAVERALQIVDKIQNGAIPLDVATITDLLAQQSAGPDAQLLNIASAVLMIAWLIGIVDSYRVGHQQDKANAAKG